MNFKSKNLTDEELLSYSKGRIYNERDINLRGSTPATIQGGLYDKRIFGSDRYCECGISFSAGHVCPRCATHIESPDKLKERFGHIELRYPYISPFQIPTFIKDLKIVFGKSGIGQYLDGRFNNLSKLLCLLNSLEFKLKFTNDEESEFTAESYKVNCEITEAVESSNPDDIGLAGIKKVLETIDRDQVATELNNLLHKVLLVSPAIRRMYSATNIKGSTKVTFPQPTIDYQCIIFANNTLPSVFDICKSTEEYMAKVTGLQLMIGCLFTNSALAASSKESFVRGAASTGAYKSGRATIVSDPNLKVTEVSIPWKLLYHSIQVDIRKRLESEGCTEVDLEYRNVTDKAKKAFDDIIEQSCALMVRNPSLHKYNLTAFKIIPNHDEVIHLPPLVCGGFNADKH